MQEQWKTIQSAPHYEISSLGRVRRSIPDWQGKYAGRILAPSRQRRGYLAHVLCTSEGRITRKVHRLVCEAFNGPQPDDKPHCAHRDGNVANNTPDNLYWATAQENADDRERHGTTCRGPMMERRKPIGDRHWTRMFPERVRRGDNHPRRLADIALKGQDNGNAKLSEAQVRDILSEPNTHGSGKTLAERYGVSMGLISAIRKGRAWAHIPR